VESQDLEFESVSPSNGVLRRNKKLVSHCLTSPHFNSKQGSLSLITPTRLIDSSPFMFVVDYPSPPNGPGDTNANQNWWSPIRSHPTTRNNDDGRNTGPVDRMRGIMDGIMFLCTP